MDMGSVRSSSFQSGSISLMFFRRALSIPSTERRDRRASIRTVRWDLMIRDRMAERTFSSETRTSPVSGTGVGSERMALKSSSDARSSRWREKS